MKHKNLTLILGLSIPVATLLIVAAITFLPAAFIKPTVSFAYAVGGPNTYDSMYVNGGKVEKHISQYRDVFIYASDPEPTLYIHNTATNTSESISLEELQKKQVKNTAFSTDGFTIQHGHMGGYGFFFDDLSPTEKVYLRKGVFSKAQNVVTSSRGHNFQMLGWVE